MPSHVILKLRVLQRGSSTKQSGQIEGGAELDSLRILRVNKRLGFKQEALRGAGGAEGERRVSKAAICLGRRVFCVYYRDTRDSLSMQQPGRERGPDECVTYSPAGGCGI